MRFTCVQAEFFSSDHFRVLLSIEMGSKNHESVPVELISKISRTKCNLETVFTDLVKQKFIKRVPTPAYEGYALTYTGYDNLALYALAKEGALHSLGDKIGVGKESDVYIGATEAKKLVCVKIHRLGRTCFKAVKNKRDYHENRKHATWMYLSRLSAEKEYEHMQSLSGKIPIPQPLSQNRHVVIMEYLSEYVALSKVPAPHLTLPASLKEALVKILDAIKDEGYVHGDFNEFNIMIRRDYKRVRIIDFPQMVKSTDEKAEEYYARDRKCIEEFFKLPAAN